MSNYHDDVTCPKSLDTNLYYEDMNIANNGIARDTQVVNAWTRLFGYTGDGLLLGFLVTLERLEEEDPLKSWAIRLIVDGIEIFGATGMLMSDLQDLDLYNFNRDITKGIPNGFGFSIRNKTLKFESPSNLLISYKTNVEIYVKKISDFKNFRAGLAILTKN